MFRGIGTILISVLMIAVANSAFADSGGSSAMERPNSLSFELLGRGLLYSLNYDREVTPEIGVGFGLSFWKVGAHDADNKHYEATRITIVPIYLDYYFYNNRGNRFYVNGGLDMISAKFSDSAFTNDSDSGVYFVAGTGYEYRGDNGFLFRGTLYLFFAGDIHLWPGLSLGYSF